MFKRILIFTTVLSVLIAGCGAASPAYAPVEQSVSGAAPAYDSARADESKGIRPAGGGEGTFNVAATSTERLMNPIRT